MKDREKEIKHLMYIKNQIIKQEKKDIKKLREELQNMQKVKRK